MSRFDTATRRGHPSEFLFCWGCFVVGWQCHLTTVTFALIIVFATIEVRTSLYFLLYIILNHLWIARHFRMARCKIWTASEFSFNQCQRSHPLPSLHFLLDGILFLPLYDPLPPLRFHWISLNKRCEPCHIVRILMSCHYYGSKLILSISLFFTWVFWLAGAAAITESLGGGLDCSYVPQLFVLSPSKLLIIYVEHRTTFIVDNWTLWKVSHGLTGTIPTSQVSLGILRNNNLSDFFGIFRRSCCLGYTGSLSHSHSSLSSSVESQLQNEETGSVDSLFPLPRQTLSRTQLFPLYSNSCQPPLRFLTHGLIQKMLYNNILKLYSSAHCWLGG